MIAGTVQPKVRFTSTPAAFRRVGNTPNWPRSIIISSIVEAPQQNIRPILRSNGVVGLPYVPKMRSEEHTSELQSLMRISYAVFCLKKKKQKSTVHKPIRRKYIINYGT